MNKLIAFVLLLVVCACADKVPFKPKDQPKAFSVETIDTWIGPDKLVKSQSRLSFYGDFIIMVEATFYKNGTEIAEANKDYSEVFLLRRDMQDDEGSAPYIHWNESADTKCELEYLDASGVSDKIQLYYDFFTSENDWDHVEEDGDLKHYWDDDEELQWQIWVNKTTNLIVREQYLEEGEIVSSDYLVYHDDTKLSDLQLDKTKYSGCLDGFYESLYSYTLVDDNPCSFGWTCEETAEEDGVKTNSSFKMVFFDDTVFSYEKKQAETEYSQIYTIRADLRDKKTGIVPTATWNKTDGKAQCGEETATEEVVKEYVGFYKGFFTAEHIFTKEIAGDKGLVTYEHYVYDDNKGELKKDFEITVNKNDKTSFYKIDYFSGYTNYDQYTFIEPEPLKNYVLPNECPEKFRTAPSENPCGGGDASSSDTSRTKEHYIPPTTAALGCQNYVTATITKSVTDLKTSKTEEEVDPSTYIRLGNITFVDKRYPKGHEQLIARYDLAFTEGGKLLIPFVRAKEEEQCVVANITYDDLEKALAFNVVYDVEEEFFDERIENFPFQGRSYTRYLTIDPLHVLLVDSQERIRYDFKSTVKDGVMTNVTRVITFYPISSPEQYIMLNETLSADCPDKRFYQAPAKNPCRSPQPEPSQPSQPSQPSPTPKTSSIPAGAASIRAVFGVVLGAIAIALLSIF